MNENILHLKLNDFNALAIKNNIDFAKITYHCHAIEFISISRDIVCEEDVIFYRFDDLFLEEPKYWEYTYYVLAMVGKSYLMYEIEDTQITIWVCYTEEKHRNKGCISMLLSELIALFPGEKIIGDTRNESLIKIFKSKRIGLFSEQPKKQQIVR